MEAALLVSEARFRAAAEGSLDAFFILESVRDEHGHIRDFTFVDMNTRSETLLGLPRAAVVGHRLLELFPVSSRNGSLEKYIQVAETGIALEEELSAAGAGLRASWVQRQIVPLLDGVAITSRDITARKASEEAFREDNARFQSAFTYAAIGMALVALDGRWLQANPALCELTGYSEPELLQRTFQELTHPDDLATDLDLAQQLMAGRLRSYQMEKRYIHRLGHIVWVLLNVSLVHDAQGRPLYFLSQIQDITERKQAEQALQESEDRFRQLYDLSPDGIVLLDPHDPNRVWPIVDCNTAFCQMNGYRREELIGQSIDMVNVEPLLPDVAAAYLAQLRSEDVVSGESMHRRGDGSSFPLEFSTSLITVAGRELVLGIDRDRTARKQAEAQLRTTLAQLEEQYRIAEHARSESRALLDATADAIVLVAPDRRLLTINQRFAALFAVRPEDVIGRRFNDLWSFVERAFVDAVGFGALVSGSAADTEQQFSGSVVQQYPEHHELELFSTPVRNNDGTYLGRVYAFRDVTHQRELDRMKTDFMHMVTHDLRTPLSSIKGYVDLLLEGLPGDLNAEQREFLEIVDRSADRQLALINELLEIARLESNIVELTLALVDLGHAVAEVHSLLRPQIATKHQTVTLQIDDALPLVWGDAGRIRQVLTNLLSNANKYTPDGGQLFIAARQEGSMVRVEVRDTGIGLAAHEQAQLFTKFFRAQNRTTREAGGTGLGLAMSRLLIEAHGGEISVTSAPGKGSIFSFTLPIAPA